MPYTYDNPYLGLGTGQPKPPPAIPPLEPQEEDSLLAKLTGGALSGLGYVGGILDKTFGGRAIRGALGGNARELASIIPFSDTLGITNESDVVRGRDLLTKAGILDAPTPGFDLGDVAGFGVDMLLDPATYLSFGGKGVLNATGLAAKKQRQLAGTVAEQIGQGQRGLARASLPFFPQAGVDLGTGQTAQAVAGKLGQYADKALYSPPGRAISGLFDKTTEGHISEPVQRAARDANAAYPPRLKTYRGGIEDIARKLQESGTDAGPGASTLRDILEGQMSPLPNTPGGQALGRAAGDIEALQKPWQPALAERGMNASVLEDYAHRQRTPVDVPTPGYGRSRGNAPLDPMTGSEIAREDAYRDLPTSLINQMSVHPVISGPNRLGQGTGNTLQEAAFIRRNWQHPGVSMTPKMEADYAALKQANPPRMMPDPANPANMVLNPDYDRLQALERPWQRSFDLSEKMAQMDPKRAAEGLPLFGNNLFSDLLHRGQQQARMETRSEGLVNALASTASELHQIGPDAVPIAEAAAKAGLPNWQGLVQNLAGKLGKTTDEVAKLHVPGEVAADLGRATQLWTQPEALAPLIRGIDSLTALFKGYISPIWPAYHARNLAQNTWMQMVKGWINPANIVPAYRDGMALTREANGVAQMASKVPDLAHLAPEAATKAIQQEMFAHGVVGSGRLTREANIAQGVSEHAAQKTFAVPGTEAAPSALSIIQGGVPTSLQDVKDLAKVKGVGDITRDVAKPVAAGREIDRAVDDVTRATTYLQARVQGYNPAAAAEEVLKTHYDYSNLSQFEKSVMRRVIPYYSWMRQNIPAQLKQLFEEPGGRTGAAVRATADLKAKPGEFVPEYLGGGLAVPVGQEENGQQRFVSNLGLPFEDAFRELGVGHGLTANVGRTLENMLGNTNPLIKGPLELATGKQFYTGRDLADLQGPTGNVLADQVLMNSPASRALTTARTLGDERKGLLAKVANLASPVKVTDVDMEKQRQIAARTIIDDLLRGSPGVHQYQSLYVKPEDVPNLPPSELQLLQLSRTLEKQAQDQARKKKVGQP